METPISGRSTPIDLELKELKLPMETPTVSRRTSFEGLDDLERTNFSSSDKSYPSSLAAFADEAEAVTLGLTQVDGGKAAWSFLVGATVLEVLVFGFPASIGVLLQVWKNELFPQPEAKNILALTATLVSGLLYFTGILFTPLFRKFPHQRMNLQLIGLLGASISLILSSFVTEPWHLLVSIGLLYPLSGLLYLPAATLLFEHFNLKRGLASGIMFSGVGGGGTAFPFIMDALLNRFNYKTTMISLGVGYFIIGLLATSQIKPRIPVPKRGSINYNRKLDKSFLKRSSFLAFTFAILLTSLAGFVPIIWIPTFAADLNLSQNDGTILVALMSASSVPGLLFFGWLSDKIPLRVCILLSCVGSSLSTLLLWGFAANFKLLAIFSIAFGFFGLSFSSTWSQLITLVAQDDPALPPVILSLFAASKGIGSAISGPISTALLNSHWTSKVWGVNSYGSLILYSGVVMFVGGIVGCLYRTTPKTRIY